MGNTTIFDDVLRTIQERRPELLIPLINEVFQTSYSLDTKVNRLAEEHQKLLAKVIADSCNEVEGKTYIFHVRVSFIFVPQRIRYQKNPWKLSFQMDSMLHTGFRF